MTDLRTKIGLTLMLIWGWAVISFAALGWMIPVFILAVLALIVLARELLWLIWAGDGEPR